MAVATMLGNYHPKTHPIVSAVCAPPAGSKARGQGLVLSNHDRERYEAIAARESILIVLLDEIQLQAYIENQGEGDLPLYPGWYVFLPATDEDRIRGTTCDYNGFGEFVSYDEALRDAAS